MHWDYRVFFEDGIYTIRTVYSDNSGAIAACSAKEVDKQNFADIITDPQY